MNADVERAVDVEEVVADLVDAGRILERYEDPRMKPLSEESFRIYDGVRQVIHARKLTLTRALGCNGFQWLEEVIEEMRRDARAFPISSFQRARLEATADKLTRIHQGQNSIALSRGNASLFGKAHEQA